MIEKPDHLLSTRDHIVLTTQKLTLIEGQVKQAVWLQINYDTASVMWQQVGMPVGQQVEDQVFRSWEAL